MTRADERLCKHKEEERGRVPGREPISTINTYQMYVPGHSRLPNPAVPLALSPSSHPRSAPPLPLLSTPATHLRQPSVPRLSSSAKLLPLPARPFLPVLPPPVRPRNFPALFTLFPVVNRVTADSEAAFRHAQYSLLNIVLLALRSKSETTSKSQSNVQS